MIGIQVTIEYIFAVPGMGSAVLNAVVNRDFPVIQGFTLVISAFFLFANIMADLFYACSTRASGIEMSLAPSSPYRITSSFALAAGSSRGTGQRCWASSAWC